MTTMLVAPAPTPPAHRRRLAPVTLAAAFVLAWIVGLTVYSSSTDVHSGGAAVLRGFAGHHSAAAVQYAVTEGATSLLLIALVGAIAGRTALVVAGTAAAVGLAELALGLGLTLGSPNASSAGTLFAAIDRLDGVKMLLLAGLALILVSGRPGPRWLRGLAVVLAVSITASGLGYLTLTPSLAAVAYVSLPALIAFVAALGWVASRQP